jgi:hypothetical protein
MQLQRRAPICRERVPTLVGVTDGATPISRRVLARSLAQLSRDPRRDAPRRKTTTAAKRTRSSVAVVADPESARSDDEASGTNADGVGADSIDVVDREALDDAVADDAVTDEAPTDEAPTDGAIEDGAIDRNDAVATVEAPVLLVPDDAPDTPSSDLDGAGSLDVDPADVDSTEGLLRRDMVPARPLRPLQMRSRPRVRKVTRTVRHIDTWSVFKIALVFNAFLYAVCLTAGVLLWQVADTTGTIDNIENFFLDFGWETFELNAGQVYHQAWIAGLFIAAGLTGLAVLMATLFNLITDLVGGVRVTVLEEEVVARGERPMSRSAFVSYRRVQRRNARQVARAERQRRRQTVISATTGEVESEVMVDPLLGETGLGETGLDDDVADDMADEAVVDADDVDDADDASLDDESLQTAEPTSRS